MEAGVLKTLKNENNITFHWIEQHLMIRIEDESLPLEKNFRVWYLLTLAVLLI
jgi:hypothetical protein